MDPQLGRFLQRDPMGIWGDPLNQGNAYGYCGNNSPRFVDPSGKFIITGALVVGAYWLGTWALAEGTESNFAKAFSPTHSATEAIVGVDAWTGQAVGGADRTFAGIDAALSLIPGGTLASKGVGGFARFGRGVLAVEATFAVAQGTYYGTQSFSEGHWGSAVLNFGSAYLNARGMGTHNKVKSKVSTGEEDLVKVWRGVNTEHPHLRQAREGIAIPFGGHSDPIKHNLGETFSEFTSWTTSRKVAEKYANKAGPGGVVLMDFVHVKNLIESPDRFLENEVLRKGIITGAIVQEP